MFYIFEFLGNMDINLKLQKCTKCDRESSFNEDNLFCSRCGTPLVKVEAQDLIATTIVTKTLKRQSPSIDSIQVKII
jgi:hypothetical protein